MPELPHGTVTFLFTDIAGSTRLWQDHPAAMPAAYARHDAILRDACADHGGVVSKTVGDAVQAAFPTAPEAVAAALGGQRALQGEAWPLPEPLRVRMALHAGDVDPGPDGDYRSPVLNRLGRLLAAGHGGQIILSQAVAQLARDQLPEEEGLTALGTHRLKDLLEPERIFQLLHPALPSEFPDLRTLETRPHNLPLQPTPVIGREREVGEIVVVHAGRSTYTVGDVTAEAGAGEVVVIPAGVPHRWVNHSDQPLVHTGVFPTDRFALEMVAD